MQRPVIAFLGHHKCASSFFWALLRDTTAIFDVDCQYFSDAEKFNEALPSLTKAQKALCYVIANARREVLPDTPEFKAFHVIRDPRDILVSGYFSHLYSHGTTGWDGLKGYREKLQSLDKKEGLILELDFFREIYIHMCDWNYSHPQVLEITFEGYLADPEKTWKSVLDFLLEPHRRGFGLRSFRKVYRFNGHERAASRVARIHEARTFKKLSGGRTAGHEDAHHHYRKGIVGDWKNHFDAELRERFADRYGHILIQLGYEKDNSWVTARG